MRASRFDLLAMLVICIWGLVRLAPDLAHHSIWAFDESFHQVVVRHVHDHPLTPTLSDDTLHGATDLTNYWEARVWLIKPPGAFWLAALMMIFTGKVPLAFRLVGLFSQLFSALALYWFAARAARRLWALLASMIFLALPLGWVFTQAHFVGDELDLLLCACVCAAMVGLFLSVDRDSPAWAAAAGVAVGAGFLVKSYLALTPIGVGACLWGLSRLRLCRGPRLKSLVTLVGTALAVAAPWNIYAATKWPAIYAGANADVFSHIGKQSRWARPFDAIFNEVNQASYEPMPQALALAVGVWLLVRAVRKRELVTVGCALWLWATWIGHSLVVTKISSHLWNSVVPGCLGIALVLEDVWQSLPLSSVVGVGFLVPWLVTTVPALERLRQLVPSAFVQTRVLPGLAEGVCLLAPAAAVGWLLSRLTWFRHSLLPRWVAGVAAACTLCVIMLHTGASRQAVLADAMRPTNSVAYSEEVGRALDAQTPKRSVLLLDIDYSPSGQIENHNLMFWADRVVLQERNPHDYPSAGYHPYLVSPAWEPYAPLPVPAQAWLRAYDMNSPAQGGTAIPPGAQPLNISVSGMQVLGVAHGPREKDAERYAFFLHVQNGAPSPLRITFRTRASDVTQVIPPEASLRSRGRLAGAPWFVLPAVGPPSADVREIEFGPGENQRVVLHEMPAPPT